jgi:hypothetical protein
VKIKTSRLNKCDVYSMKNCKSKQLEEADWNDRRDDKIWRNIYYLDLEREQLKRKKR